MVRTPLLAHSVLQHTVCGSSSIIFVSSKVKLRLACMKVFAISWLTWKTHAQYCLHAQARSQTITPCNTTSFQILLFPWPTSNFWVHVIKDIVVFIATCTDYFQQSPKSSALGITWLQGVLRTSSNCVIELMAWWLHSIEYASCHLDNTSCWIKVSLWWKAVFPRASYMQPYIYTAHWKAIKNIYLGAIWLEIYKW